MTATRKRAICTLCIWVPVMLLFLILFLSGGGPEHYVADRLRKVLVAGLFAVGWAGYFFMLWRTKASADTPHLRIDERDRAITLQASTFSLVAVLIFVFALCLTLFTIYESRGSVPVGWLWFIAYGSAFFVYIVNAAAVLVLDSGAIVHGEG